MSKKQNAEIANLIGKPIGKKVEQLGEKIEDVGKTVQNLSEATIEFEDEMVKIISAKEKQELYGLSNIVDISEIDDAEKEFLISALFTLANESEIVTDTQQGYLRSLKKYLNIANAQNEVDLSNIENIDSKKAEQAVLQCIMEYLFLAKNTHDYLDEYSDLFDHFTVKQSVFRNICKNIDAVYKAVGANGLAEKYGYISEKIKEAEYTPQLDTVEVVSSDLTDSIVASSGHLWDCFVETESYFVIQVSNEQDEYVKIDKITGDRATIIQSEELRSIRRSECAVRGDIVVFPDIPAYTGKPWLIDLKTNQQTNLKTIFEDSVKHALLTEEYYIALMECNHTLIIVDLKTKEQILLTDVNGDIIKADAFTVKQDILYYSVINSRYVEESYPILFSYDLKHRKTIASYIGSEELNMFENANCVDSMVIYSNAIYLVLSDCLQYGAIVKFDLSDCSSKVKTVMEEQRGKIEVFRDNKIIFGNNKGKLFCFDFDREIMVPLASNCLQKGSYKQGAFRKKEEYSLAGNFFTMAQYVYFDYFDSDNSIYHIYSTLISGSPEVRKVK